MALENKIVSHWRATSRLAGFVLFAWFVLSFVVPSFAPQLNQIQFMGFPLGYYLAAQGILVAFVVLLFWFAAAQQRIDEAHDVAEDIAQDD